MQNISTVFRSRNSHLRVVLGLEKNPKSRDRPVEGIALLHRLLVDLLPVCSQHLETRYVWTMVASGSTLHSIWWFGPALHSALHTGHPQSEHTTPSSSSCNSKICCIQVSTPSANLETFKAVRSCDRVVGPLHQSLLTEDHLSLVNVPRSHHHPAHLLAQIISSTLQQQQLTPGLYLTIMGQGSSWSSGWWSRRWFSQQYFTFRKNSISI